MHKNILNINYKRFIDSIGKIYKIDNVWRFKSIKKNLLFISKKRYAINLCAVSDFIKNVHLYTNKIIKFLV